MNKSFLGWQIMFQHIIFMNTFLGCWGSVTPMTLYSAIAIYCTVQTISLRYYARYHWHFDLATALWNFHRLVSCRIMGSQKWWGTGVSSQKPLRKKDRVKPTPLFFGGSFMILWGYVLENEEKNTWDFDNWPDLLPRRPVPTALEILRHGVANQRLKNRWKLSFWNPPPI